MAQAAYPRVALDDGLRRREGSALIAIAASPAANCTSANSTSRAGSPLLFGLAPRGVFRASRIAT